MSPTKDHPLIRAEEERATRPKRAFHFWESFWRVVLFALLILGGLILVRAFLALPW